MTAPAATDAKKPETLADISARVRAMDAGLLKTLDDAASKAIDLQMGGATHAQSWGPLQSELSPQTLRVLVQLARDGRVLADALAAYAAGHLFTLPSQLPSPPRAP